MNRFRTFPYTMVYPITNSNDIITNDLKLNQDIVHEHKLKDPELDGFTGTELAFNNYLRKLWRNYIYWLRYIIIDVIYNLPEKDAAISHILSTTKEVSQLYGYFYGEAAAKRFNELMTYNILTTIKLLEEILKNDDKAIQEQRHNWLRNALDIAVFYNTLNPVWRIEEWKPLLQGLLDEITLLINYIIEGKYEESINLFNEMSRYQIVIINLTFEGIVEQFPDIFK